MATKPKTAPVREPGASTLPPLGPLCVAHVEEATRLLGALVDTEQDVFIAAAQRHRMKHRVGTERPLTAQESAQIAASMVSAVAMPPVDVAVAVQKSELRGYEHPDPRELLLAGGVATAPGFLKAVRRFTALVEMTTVELRFHREEGDVDAELDTLAAEMAYEDLDGEEGYRARAIRAGDHFAKAAGAGSGKLLATLTKAAWQVVEQATTTLGLRSAPSSLSGSPPSLDGPSETSSTASRTSEQ